MAKDKCLKINAVCPERSHGPGNYCPAWQEIIQENPRTGETRVVKDCIDRLMPQLMVEVIKGSNRPAEQISMLQNGLQTAFTQLTEQAMSLTHAPRDN